MISIMKKIIFMFVLLFAPLIVKAECSTDEVIRLKSLASKISITYDYTEKNGYISFSATFHNVHKDLKLIDVTNKEYSSNEEFSDVKIDNLNFSGTYYVNIVSKLQNCKNELMLKKYYTIPYYNSYSYATSRQVPVVPGKHASYHHPSPSYLLCNKSVVRSPL